MLMLSRKTETQMFLFQELARPWLDIYINDHRQPIDSNDSPWLGCLIKSCLARPATDCGPGSHSILNFYFLRNYLSVVRFAVNTNC